MKKVWSPLEDLIILPENAGAICADCAKQITVEVKDLEKVAENYAALFFPTKSPQIVENRKSLTSLIKQALTESTAPLLLEIKELKATVQMQSSALSVTEQDKEKQELLERIHKQESQIAVLEKKCLDNGITPGLESWHENNPSRQAKIFGES